MATVPARAVPLLSDQQCNNCLYWRNDHPTDDSAGYCHRFPPVFEAGARYTFTEWPVTDGGDWCGEWKDDGGRGQRQAAVDDAVN